MEIATSVEEVAHRLGLGLEAEDDDPSRLEISRRGQVVNVDTSDLVDASRPTLDHMRAAWFLLGIRFGLDKLTPPDDGRPDSPQTFRRTQLRRYHEAPSVHGDRLPLLVPTVTREAFEAVSATSAFTEDWIVPGLCKLIVCETGKRLDILTVDEQEQSDKSDELRWEKARSALFYQSYKVRPQRTIDVDGGRLRIIETSEGFGASRALLLPEFDYDASRDYGYLAVPTRDRIIIARPHHRDLARKMLPALREAVRQSVEESNVALSDAIIQLEPEGLRTLEESSVELDIDPPVASRIETSPENL